MTLKELIIGHYEGALTAEQQETLQGMLDSSPEARTMYEQYGAMEEAMEEESKKLVPPIALRDATIVGALGVAAESIGGGIAAWFTSKAAVAVGTLIVAGTAVGIVVSENNDSSNPDSVVVPVIEQAEETSVQGESPTVDAGEIDTDQNSRAPMISGDEVVNETVSAAQNETDVPISSAEARADTNDGHSSFDGSMTLGTEGRAKIETTQTVRSPDDQ